MTAPAPVSRLRRWTCNVVAVCVLAVIGTLFYFALDRKPPFVRDRGELFPARPKPGDWVTVRWHVTGNGWCPGTLRRQVIDSHDVVWSLDQQPVAFGVSIPAGSPDFFRSFQLPPGAWPGRAVYRVTTSYVCNPLHRWWPVVTTGPDVVFEIGIPDDLSEVHPQRQRTQWRGAHP